MAPKGNGGSGNATLEALNMRMHALEREVVALRAENRKIIGATGKELAELNAGLGRLLLKNGRPRMALQYCRRAMEMRPDDLELTRDLADALALSNRFQEAAEAYRKLAAANPDDPVIHELLAAMGFMGGKPDQGRKDLRAFFARRPVKTWTRGARGQPVILRISGLDGTTCSAVRDRNNRPQPSYQGGHFTTTFLLPEKGYRVFNWTIADDNINIRDDVPDHDLMLNTVAEPDTERRSLESLDRFLAGRPDIALINHPARVLETTRDNNWRRFSKIAGLAFPRTERLAKGAMDAPALVRRIREMGFAYPMILRETGTHTARTVILADDADEAERYFAKAKGTEFYVIEYIEERLDGGFFNKKRMFCIDGVLYPVVSHIDTVWNVHGMNRLTVMRNAPWMQEQEQAYIKDPASAIGAENHKILQGLHDVVGLDFFGIDFTVRADGSLLIFEVNASMRHSDDHSRNFDYLRPNMDRITDAFADMLRKRIVGPTV